MPPTSRTCTYTLGFGFVVVVFCFAGSLMEKMFVPIVGTMCGEVAFSPSFVSFVSRCVLPEYFGPRHKTDMVLSEFFDSFVLGCLFG